MAKKTQKISAKKSVISIIVALLVAILGVVIVLKKCNTSVVPEQRVVTAIAEQQIEKITARIDFTTTLVDEENPQFEVYVDGAENPEKQVGWMPRLGYQGYTVQRKSNKAKINIKVLNDAEITMILRGPDKRDANNKIIENWVDYTSVTINGDEILPKTTATWHNKVFRHMINATAGDEIEIKARWKKHEPVIVE